MWYIKRGSKTRQYLSIYGGWRNPDKMADSTISCRHKNEPLLRQWVAELVKFDLKSEADRYIVDKRINGAHATNMIVTI